MRGRCIIACLLVIGRKAAYTDNSLSHSSSLENVSSQLNVDKGHIGSQRRWDNFESMGDDYYFDQLRKSPRARRHFEAMGHRSKSDKQEKDFANDHYGANQIQGSQEQYLVLRQNELNIASPEAHTADQQTAQTENLPENGLLVFAQKIVEEQKDLRELQELNKEAEKLHRDYELVQSDHIDTPMTDQPELALNEDILFSLASCDDND